MPDYSGQSIGRYHLIEPLGQGGMAIVYRAYDTHLECEVAVKFIRMERLAPEDAQRTLKRFEREAKELARLTHPNIVKVTDYGEYDGTPYLVMPFLPGGTLKEMAGKPIPFIQAARLLAPVARALEYAHEEKLIHRDIKPGNILLTSKGQPMVADFGIAKILDAEGGSTLTGTNVAIGTPEYMAPEQWLNQISPQTDIYALGIVFYELVTGRKPYTADTPAAVFLKQSTDPLPRPRDFVVDLPEEVEKVLFKALARKLENRYADMGLFASALEGLAFLPEAAPAVQEKNTFPETEYIQPPAVAVEPAPAYTVLRPSAGPAQAVAASTLIAPAVAPPAPVPASAEFTAPDLSAAESTSQAESTLPRVEPLPFVTSVSPPPRPFRAWGWLAGLAGLAVIVVLGVTLGGKVISMLAPQPVAVLAKATNTLVQPASLPTLPAALPQLTPVPSSTVRPAATKVITLTPAWIPVPPILADNLVGVKMVGMVDFRSNFDANWNKFNPQSGSVDSQGNLKIVGQPGWSSGVARAKPYSEGQGVLLSYYFDVRNECSFAMSSGTWKTDGFRNFGVYGCTSTKTDLTFGKNDLGFNYLAGNFTVKPATWYNLMMAVAPGGEFKALIWDPVQPSNQIYYRQKFGSGWEGLPWDFVVKSGNDKLVLMVKNFTEFTFLRIR
jgi:eukaryotic-like serine/threonine-protein kinase